MSPAAIIVIWIVYASSAHEGTVQHVSMARYEGRTEALAMAACERDRSAVIAGLEREGLKILIEPRCTREQPRFWIAPGS